MLQRVHTALKLEEREKAGRLNPMVSPPDRVVRLQCKGAMAIGKLPWAWQRQGGSLRSLLPTLGPFLQLPIGSRAHTHVYRAKGLVSGMIHTSSTQDLPAAASKSRGIVTRPKKEWEMGRPPSHLLGQLCSPWASSPTLSGRYMSTRRPPVASEMRPPAAHSTDTPADLISSPAAEGKFGSPSCQSPSLCAADFSHLPHLSHLPEPSSRSPSSVGSHISLLCLLSLPRRLPAPPTSPAWTPDALFCFAFMFRERHCPTDNPRSGSDCSLLSRLQGHLDFLLKRLDMVLGKIFIRSVRKTKS